MMAPVLMLPHEVIPNKFIISNSFYHNLSDKNKSAVNDTTRPPRPDKKTAGIGDNEKPCFFIVYPSDGNSINTVSPVCACKHAEALPERIEISKNPLLPNRTSGLCSATAI